MYQNNWRRRLTSTILAAATAVGAIWLGDWSACATAADAKASLKEGAPEIKSAGALAFAPDGILLIGDAQSGAIFAVDTGESSGAPPETFAIEAVDQKIADLLGVTPRDILINDLAVNPLTGTAYLSVSRGRGPEAASLILRATADGKIEELSLKNVKFAKAELPNAPDAAKVDRRGQRLRDQSITDLEYVDGRVFVAGLSNEEFASNLRAIPFPFEKIDGGASVEIYHGAHGGFETNSPVRTFTHYKIDGEDHLLAAYTCTPLVKFPIAQLKGGEKVKGVTVAELGNRNRPLDMLVYEKDGKDFILLANNSRGVMKITTDEIGKIEGITDRVADTAGLSYDTLGDLKGVTQLDRLNESSALLLVQTEGGAQNLQTVVLP